MVRKKKDWKFYYWCFIVTLLIFPITNSFFIGLTKLVKLAMINNQYKSLVDHLSNENETLQSKVEYYMTASGIKSLIKERLNKVEDGEVIVKFKDRIED